MFAQLVAGEEGPQKGTKGANRFTAPFVLSCGQKESVGGPTLGALTGPPTPKHRANPPSFDLNPVRMKNVSTL